jgi:hypothetical protein
MKATLMSLGKYASDGKITSICFDYGGEIRIKVFEDGSGGESSFQSFKSCLASACPTELVLGFLQTVCKWSTDCREILYETSVVVGKSQETLNVFDGRGLFP